jgi:hypothetical protein
MRPSFRAGQGRAPLSRERQATHGPSQTLSVGPSVPTDSVRGRPWETDGYTDRPDGRTPSAIRPWTAQHNGPQRYEMTHGGTKKKRPAQPRIRS